MKKIIPKDKLSPQERKKLSLKQRCLWAVQPVTRIKESKKRYLRHEKYKIEHKEGT